MPLISKKSMTKIVNLCEYKTDIAPAPGPPIHCQYSKDWGHRVREKLSFQVPQGRGLQSLIVRDPLRGQTG